MGGEGIQPTTTWNQLSILSSTRLLRYATPFTMPAGLEPAILAWIRKKQSTPLLPPPPQTNQLEVPLEINPQLQ